jgi:hypothetical protein
VVIFVWCKFRNIWYYLYLTRLPTQNCREGNIVSFETSSHSQQYDLGEIADQADESRGVYAEARTDNEGIVQHIEETMSGTEGVEMMIAHLVQVGDWAKKTGHTLHGGNKYTEHNSPQILEKEKERLGELAATAVNVTEGSGNSLAEALVNSLTQALANGESAHMHSQRGLEKFTEAVTMLVSAATTIGEVVGELRKVTGILETTKGHFKESGTASGDAVPQLQTAADSAREYAGVL